jgi:hypothetical protein
VDDLSVGPPAIVLLIAILVLAWFARPKRRRPS